MTKKIAVCALESLLALAGCASSPSQPCVQVSVAGPQIQAPAAWAMQPSNSTRKLDSVFSISAPQSSLMLRSSNTSGLTLKAAGGLGLTR